MKVLETEALRACDQPGATVALVRVVKAELEAPGTRSEAAILELAVEQSLCGTAPPVVQVWRYTSGRDTLLRTGRRYIVTFGAGEGLAPFGLGEFVEVPAGREAEAVEAHLHAIEAMRQAGKK